MKMDLSCPIEVRSCTLTPAGDAARACVRLYNLSPRRIESFEAIVKWRNAAGRNVVSPISPENLRAAGESGFQIDLAAERLPDADSMELLFTTVRFEDGGDEWRGGNGMIVEVDPLPKLPAKELTMLRAAAGEDAACYPRQEAQVWQCVCGRTNPNGESSCARCHRDHFAALGFTRENVIFHHESRRPEMAAKAESPKKRRIRPLRRAMTVVVALLALTAVAVNWPPVFAAIQTVARIYP